MQVLASDNFARRLGPYCVRLLVCFADTKHMVKGESTDDQLLKLFCGDHEGTVVGREGNLLQTIVP